jgi:hypothetical protein
MLKLRLLNAQAYAGQVCRDDPLAGDLDHVPVVFDDLVLDEDIEQSLLDVVDIGRALALGANGVDGHLDRA